MGCKCSDCGKWYKGDRYTCPYCGSIKYNYYPYVFDDDDLRFTNIETRKKKDIHSDRRKKENVSLIKWS